MKRNRQQCIFLAAAMAATLLLSGCTSEAEEKRRNIRNWELPRWNREIMKAR